MRMVRRRDLVTGLASIGVFGMTGWATVSTAAAQTTAGTVRLRAPLSREAFLALKLEKFQVFLADDIVSVFLIDVEDGGPSDVSDQFTVVFRGAHTRDLPADTYTVRHRTAGKTRLYLQPAGTDGRYRYYTATFNLLR